MLGFMEGVAAIEAELRGRTEALGPQRVIGAHAPSKGSVTRQAPLLGLMM
jgi:hypothetical protein